MLIGVLLIIGVIAFFTIFMVLKSKNKEIDNEAPVTKQSDTATQESSLRIMSEKEHKLIQENPELALFEDAYKNALNGSNEDMELIAIFYEELGINDKAFYWMQKAAKNGYASAMYFLALYYGQGVGVEKDTMYATYWMTEAASKGDQNAIDFLSESLPEEELRKLGIKK